MTIAKHPSTFVDADDARPTTRRAPGRSGDADTLCSRFEDTVRRTPDGLAVCRGDRSVTYAALNAKANQLARHLRQLGVDRGSVVALGLERSIEMLVAILGVLKSGAAYTPIDPDYPKARQAFMIADAGADIVLTISSLADRIEKHDGLKFLFLDQDWSLIAAHRCDDLGVPVTDRDLAYVIYTSGSTGRPKGVEVEHRGPVNMAAWCRREAGLTPADRSILYSAPAFDATVLEIWPALFAGASLHVVDDAVRTQVTGLAPWLVRHRITVAWLPTPLIGRLCAAAWPDDACLRLLWTGGDRLRAYPPPGLPFRLVNLYGPTEASVLTTSYRVPVVAGPTPLPPIGTPIDRATCRVVGADGRPVPAGGEGELWIGGTGLARGYRNDPARTAGSFVVPAADSGLPQERHYRTGDLVRALPDGTLTFLGRIDAQVQVRGHRVELGEVEAALKALPGVEDAVVVGRDDDGGGDGGERTTRLVAYWVAAAGAPPPARLRDQLAVRLPAYMIPAAMVAVPAFPLTAHGKIDRAALPAPPPAAADAGGGAPPAASGAIAGGVARVWREITGRWPPDETTRFWDAGGDSLKVETLTLALESAFALALPVDFVLKHPTVRSQADRLSGLVGTRTTGATPAGVTLPNLVAGSVVEPPGSDGYPLTALDGEPIGRVDYPGRQTVQSALDAARACQADLDRVPVPEIVAVIRAAMDHFMVDERLVATLSRLGGASVAHLRAEFDALKAWARACDGLVARALGRAGSELPASVGLRQTAPVVGLLPGNSLAETLFVPVQAWLARNAVILRPSRHGGAGLVVHDLVRAIARALSERGASPAHPLARSLSLLNTPATPEALGALAQDGWTYVMFGTNATTAHLSRLLLDRCTPRRLIRFGTGFSSAVLLPGADLDRAIPEIAAAVATNRGKDCISTDIVYVDHGRLRQTIDRLAAALDRLTADEVVFGRVAAADQAACLAELARRGKSGYARCVPTDADADAGGVGLRGSVVPLTAAEPAIEYPGPIVSVKAFTDLDQLGRLIAADLDAAAVARNLVTAVYAAHEPAFRAVLPYLRAYTVRWNRPTHALDLMQPHQGIFLLRELADLITIERDPPQP